MTQGIREFVNTTFNETLPRLGEMGNIAFRREVMDQAIMAFGISVGSAATHYNHALKAAREAVPELVATLGRAEDKKGGRKPIHTVDVIKVKTGELVIGGISKAKAEMLITKAAATPNKPRLMIRVVETAPAVEAVVETAPAVEAEAALV